MTRPHAATSVDAPDLDSALDVLRSQGMRASAARRLVLGTLYAADRPLTAEQIADGFGGRMPRSDPASVYRNLETLERAGLVRHIHLGHGPGLYERADRPLQEYLICDACGQVRAVDPAALARVRALIQRELGHEAHFTHFPLPGLCARCARTVGKKVKRQRPPGRRQPRA
jgi:Fur family ferric uptake transcriptional regulator